ncbi:MAG TPA: toll/interleukin-1 receptor domain-containing protein [Parafilimonas sp.]|nr:toll/interleukin-1 receptor domain-containing protein [Parafilimonas sp.]
MKTSFKIFINYRREDTSGYAGRMFDSLAEEFGEGNIFIDVTKIDTGTDYTDVITRALDLSSYFLILIGNTWMDCKDASGNRRLDNPEDFVRKEIRLAIEKKTTIIPVLLEDTNMPSPENLPEDIREICKWQAIEVTDTRWKYDIDKLIKSINLKKKFFTLNRKYISAVVLVLIMAVIIGIWKFRSGGAPSHPLTPKDYYHNAKMYELNGDFTNARKAYKEYLKFNLLFIDPHMSYQSMIKSQEGKQSAQQEYKALLSINRNIVIEFANCLLMDRDNEIPGLLQLLKQDPMFAPAFYQLSIEYSQNRLGERSLSEKSLERQYLVAFLHLDSSGNNLKYYLDKKIAEEQTEDARNRLKQLAYATEVVKSQVFPTYMLANDGWYMYISIPEHARKIYYKFNNDTGYHFTGLSAYQYSGTDIPQANSNVFLGQLKNGHYPVSIKYIDMKENEQGPFNIVFDTEKERLVSVKKNLEMTHWVSFNKYDDNLLIYFTSLLSERDVIKEIRYSIDNESLANRFPIRPWIKGGVPEMQDDIYIKAPSATKYVCIKITFIDDSASETKRFNVDGSPE